MAIDPETRRYIDDLLKGRSFTPATFNLAASPATSTSVERIGISTGSVILPIAYSNAATTDITRIVPHKDGFVVTHSSSSTTPRTYRYVYFTGTL